MPDEKPPFAIALDMYDLNKRVLSMEGNIQKIREGLITEDRLELVMSKALTAAMEKHEITIEADQWRAIRSIQKIIWMALGGWALLMILASLILEWRK